MTVRSISSAVAAVLEQLELEQPLLVSSEDLDRARLETESTTTTVHLINELTSQGWLLPLRTRGFWEFAPAARAGAIGAGDPHIELRATLSRRPELPVAVAAESAAWLLGLSTHMPTREVISAPNGLRLPPAIADYRVIRMTPKLDLEDRNGLPIWRLPTLLVSMSRRPASYHDWPNVGDWIFDAAAQLAESDLRIELEDEPRSTWMRLAHLLERGRKPEMAKSLAKDAPSGSGPYYLGARDRRGRHYKKYDVIDSVLVEFQR